MTAARPATALPILAVAASLVSQNVGAAIAKSLFPVVGTEGVVALRVGLSAIMLAAILRPWRVRVDRALVPALIGYGLVLGAMNLLIYEAFARIPLGLAVAIEVMGPLGVVLIYSHHRRDLLWALLAGVGLALLLPIGLGGAALDPVGIACALGAAVCWALYIVLGTRVSALPGAAAVSWGLMAASLVGVPIGVARSGMALAAPSVLLVGVAVALLSSAIPYTLEIVALRRLPRAVFGILMSGAPAMSALIGYLLLGERLTGVQWSAMACIIAASIGSTLAHRRDPAAAAAVA